MEHPSFLLQAFVFLVAAVISVPIAKRLGLGAVLGYLIAGVVIGPFGLGLFGDPDSLMHTAEFGVVIMLFLIGLELAPALLWRMRTAIFGLGALQVLLTGALIAAIAVAFGVDWRPALAIGFTFALSSTAIVLQSLREKGLDATNPGRDAFATLLFQDIAVIPMLALFPLLALSAPRPEAEGTALSALPGWAQPIVLLAAVAAIVVAGRILLRPLFRFIARTNMTEMFTALALALVVGVALLMQSVGLSPALGAFIAGVVLADSEYRHELESDIEPFRALLLGLFFISVGASVDLALIGANPGLVLALVAGLIVVKTLLLYFVARVMGRPRADAALVALALAQGGEFAFVLFAFARAQGVLSEALSAPLVAAVAISMALTPFLLIAGERLASRMARPAQRAAPAHIHTHKPRVIIAGFGRFGQVIHRLLAANGVTTSILDHSADHVDMVRSFGTEANYGDAARIDLLRVAGAGDAQLLVIAIDDAERALQLAENARKHFPHLKIIARAFDRRHVYELLNRGVDGFERETFEGALRLGSAALRHLGARAHQAERAAGLFRRHDERQLLMMREHWSGDDNFEAYRSAVNARRDMLAEALRRDLDTHGVTTPDDAWDTDSLDAETQKRA